MASNLVTNLQATPYPIESITKMGQFENLELQIARNQIMGHSTVNIYGYQTAVTSAVIPLWENATTYSYPSSAITMNLAGTSGDTAKITIVGLDANYVQISETLTLNGATAVPTVNKYFRINSMVVSQGSATNPSGAVTLKDVTNTTTYAQINAGVGRTQMAIYTVPAGYTLYLTRVDAYTSFNGNNANYVTYRNQSISSNGVVTVTQQSPFTQFYHAQRVMPRPFAEKTDIQIQCSTSTGTAAVSVAVECYLVQNDGQALPSAL
jgi:hypothetical protein